jgi:D-alanyl-D-alanine carboxypeptidase/D-alanyl-D-alanine-endopeptidase (penicillin-binding protein 4)
MRTYFSFNSLNAGWALGWALALASVCLTAQAKPATPLPTAPGNAALPASVNAALKQANVPLNAISVLVAPVNASPGEALPTARLHHRANADMNPASVMKLITTSAGLSMLGPDFTWRNRVFTDGSVKDGVLYGNLYLKGSGDPKLVVERLQNLMEAVLQKGLRDIRGDILLDGSVFDLPARNPGSFDDEPLRPYNVAPQGLLLNFSAMLFKFTPDVARGEAKVDSEPPLRNVQWSLSVPLSSAPCQDWRSQLKADFTDADHVRFAGTYPSACGEQKWPVAYVQPHTFASRMVQAMWLQAGGKLSGQARSGITPSRANLWHEAPSLPLSDIVADINKFSNNVMAQQLFLSLSSQQGTGNFEASRASVLQWWRQHLKDQKQPVLDNGSGLSRDERSSAQALAALLQLGAHSSYAQALQNSLAIAGVDGTVSRLKDRLPHSPAIGRARLKSGSLRDVASLAGYVDGLSGQRYVFVVIVNHPNANAARPALDKLLEWTVADQKKS